MSVVEWLPGPFGLYGGHGVDVGGGGRLQSGRGRRRAVVARQLHAGRHVRRRRLVVARVHGAGVHPRATIPGPHSLITPLTEPRHGLPRGGRHCRSQPGTTAIDGSAHCVQLISHRATRRWVTSDPPSTGRGTVLRLRQRSQSSSRHSALCGRRPAGPGTPAAAARSVQSGSHLAQPAETQQAPPAPRMRAGPG